MHKRQPFRQHMERVRMGGVISTSNTQSLIFALQNQATPQSWAMFSNTCRTPLSTVCYPLFLCHSYMIPATSFFFYCCQDCWKYIYKSIWPPSSPQGTNLKVCPHEFTGLISNRSTLSLCRPLHFSFQLISSLPVLQCSRRTSGASSGTRACTWRHRLSVSRRESPSWPSSFRGVKWMSLLVSFSFSSMCLFYALSHCVYMQNNILLWIIIWSYSNYVHAKYLYYYYKQIKPILQFQEILNSEYSL